MFSRTRCCTIVLDVCVDRCTNTARRLWVTREERIWTWRTLLPNKTPLCIRNDGKPVRWVEYPLGKCSLYVSFQLHYSNNMPCCITPVRVRNLVIVVRVRHSQDPSSITTHPKKKKKTTMNLPSIVSISPSFSLLRSTFNRRKLHSAGSNMDAAKRCCICMPSFVAVASD